MAEGTVLVVEDEAEVADILAYNLKRSGFHALTAHTGLAACRLVAEERPELIVLDLMLPDLNGREICRMIRGHSDERLASTPILMLTALASARDRVEGLSLGADDYLPKPFSVDEVVLRARRLVARRKADLESAERMKQLRERESALLDFQDMLFHELKNQLLAMGGYSDRLARSGDALPGDRVRRYGQAIRSTSAQLTALADELLLLRRIESGEIEVPVQVVPAATLARSVVEAHSDRAQAEGISLGERVPASLHLRANVPCATIVLSAVIDNAIKFGRRGGSVTIFCEPTAPELATFAVEDDGAGIPEDELEHVFERFHRAKNTAGTRGTGLGLYFVKTLTERMGGRVELESALGKGTTVRISLPIAA